MKIEITKTNYRLEADALIVPIFVDDAQALTRIDELTGGALRAELVKGEFNAELGQRIIAVSYTHLTLPTIYSV